MKKIFIGIASLAMVISSCSDDDSSVDNSVSKAATISAESFEFEVGDGVSEFVDITVVDPGVASNSQFLVTDKDYNILKIASDENDLEANVDFDVLRDGTAYIWHLNYEDGILGNEEGKNISAITGDFKLSNKLEVTKNGPQAAVIQGGTYRYCVNSGMPQTISDIVFSVDEDFNVLTGKGTYSTYVITDSFLNILYTPATVADFPDFDDTSVEDPLRPEEFAEAEQAAKEAAEEEGEEFIRLTEDISRDWLIWHMNYNDDLEYENPDRPNAAEILNGVEAISNSITVRRDLPVAGTITGGIEGGTPDEFNFVKDGTADHVSGIVFTDDTVLAGPSRSYIITDQATGDILGLPKTMADLEAVDFDAPDAGVCLIWHISYVGTYTTINAEVGGNTTDLKGCYALSNPITVNRTVAP